jgi:hypothetical protein
MLTKLLLQDQTTASLGKTKHNFIVHVSGRKIDLCELIWQRLIQEVEVHNTRKLVRRDFFTSLNVPPFGG